MQSMVPEVSLFFGNEETFNPNIPNTSRPSLPGKDMKMAPMASSTPMQTSNGLITNSSVPNNSNSAQNLSVPVSATNYVNFNNPSAVQNGAPKSPLQQQPLNSVNNGMSSQPNPMSSVPHHAPASSGSIQPTSPVMAQPPSHPAYPSGHPAHAGPAGMHQGAPRPYCTCPSCPRPPPQYFSRPQGGYDPMRPQGPFPRPQYSNYGPPPPRLNCPPSYNGYPATAQSLPVSHQGMYPPVHHSFPPSEYQQPASMPYSKPYPNGAPGFTAEGFPSNPGPGPVRTVPSSMQAPIQRQDQMGNPNTRPMPSQQAGMVKSAPAPQTSGGLPVHSEERKLPRTPAHSSDGQTNGPRSNQSSDASSRSSDDSGLSFTPEKHNSPAQNVSPQTNTVVTSLKSSLSTVNWDSVPPEIFQLLMRQEQQLKQLQAQIDVLTAQSLNNTAVSGAGTKTDASPPVQKCTIATNTSLALPEKADQISACMQTSQPDLYMQEGHYHNSSKDHPRSQDVTHQQHYAVGASLSSSGSGGSGCEGKTPMEIRHRGRLPPMNSTQREEGELDMTQGELVALINNMHDKTIDSVQSDMIVDLPSFQSSPTRYLDELIFCKTETVVKICLLVLR